jgi:cytochrome c-type biogenesis protein CcmH
VVAAVLVVGLTARLALAAERGIEDRVADIARELRCVVCQNLSVADSPSEMAKQMRDLIRERLLAGESPQGVRAYFVSKYGEWILLDPPKRGFNLVAWTFPLLGIIGGCVGVLIAVRRWVRRAAPAAVGETPGAVDPGYLERVRRELKELEL